MDDFVPTEVQIMRTYNKAIRRLRMDKRCSAVMESVGFLDGKTCWLIQKDSSKVAKMQVFIKVCRYDDKILEKYPESGGLTCELNNSKKRRTNYV